MDSLAVGYRAFREAWTDAAPGNGRQHWRREDRSAWSARQGLYRLYWSMYLNNTYRSITGIGEQYKATYALYRHTRGCYNPSYRLVEFHVAHIAGGELDPEAGDGSEVPTALPIAGADAGMRRAIAALWLESNWQATKALWVRTGVVCGDVGLRVRDDPGAGPRGAVTLEVVDPATIAHAVRDARGDVLSYEIRERRRDPRAAAGAWPGPAAAPADAGTPAVAYREVAERAGPGVRYATFLDERPFDWRSGPDGRPLGTGPGAMPEWEAPTPFVPLFLTKHIDLGQPWGVGELEAGRAKMDEVNDLGSKLHDQVRKLVEGAWLFSGMAPPPKTPVARAGDREPDRGRDDPAGREELKVFYANDPGARAQSLVNNADVAAVSAEIRQALDNLEDDYPELRFERLRSGGGGGVISGEALRVARQPAAARIEGRRPAYDHALTWALKAALVIGGERGLPGYEGFGLADWEGPRLDALRVGRRPVFAAEAADEVAEKLAKYQALKAATDAGLPLEVALADLGWDPKDVAEVTQIKDAERGRMEATMKAAAPVPDQTEPTNAAE